MVDAPPIKVSEYVTSLPDVAESIVVSPAQILDFVEAAVTGISVFLKIVIEALFTQPLAPSNPDTVYVSVKAAVEITVLPVEALKFAAGVHVYAYGAVELTVKVTGTVGQLAGGFTGFETIEIGSAKFTVDRTFTAELMQPVALFESTTNQVVVAEIEEAKHAPPVCFKTPEPGCGPSYHFKVKPAPLFEETHAPTGTAGPH
jgi:hypothetical protein